MLKLTKENFVQILDQLDKEIKYCVTDDRGEVNWDLSFMPDNGAWVLTMTHGGRWVLYRKKTLFYEFPWFTKYIVVKNLQTLYLGDL